MLTIILSFILLTLFNLSILIISDLISELEDVHIYREINGEAIEINIIQYLCFISLDLHISVIFYFVSVASKIFSYKVRYSDFKNSSIWIQPLMLVLGATCNLINSSLYNLVYVPHLLYNLALQEFLEELVIQSHQN